MCGICGLLTFDNAASQPEFGVAIKNMMARMQRRGPDSKGEWADNEGHIRFGFHRLAILDLTPAGDQPMHSSTGRSVIVFNGEIYNYLDLKAELETHGWQFQSRSDTEVLLAALERWGAQPALERLNGMFAFAWYDKHEKQLILARDHAGIKPLYYFVEPNKKGMVFASQYNQLFLTPWGEPGNIKMDTLHLYLRLNHLPPPHTLHKNTYQLEPGHFLTIRVNGQIEKRCWWRMPRNPEPHIAGGEAIDAVAQSLENAIHRQRIADVPLGVFLSGGVDSPLVSAVARKQSGSKLQAYTVGNPGWWQDESAAAKNFAEKLDLDFHLQNISGDDVLAIMQDVWSAQYEPFADFSIIPTLLVSRFARESLTIALSGDGGDELFFGYERPLSLLHDGGFFRWPWVVRYGLYGLGRLGLGEKRSEAIAARTPADYYFGVNARFSSLNLKRVAPDLPDLPPDFDLYDFDGYQGERHLANYSRYVEFYGQLQRGLKKVDMASMYHSLEVRVPLLDREVIETSLRIDPFTHLANGERKQILFRLLERYIPVNEIPQSKRGFAVPLGEWLRGSLRPMVEDTMFGTAGLLDGIFDRVGLCAYWQEHLSGEKDHKWGLWGLLSLHGWVQTHC